MLKVQPTNEDNGGDTLFVMPDRKADATMFAPAYFVNIVIRIGSL